jgi:hypothetical protein
MKIKSRVTGEIRDLSDEGARTLVYAGIYDLVEPPKEPKKDPPPKKADKPEKSTKVEPLTTEDMPVPTKTVP